MKCRPNLGVGAIAGQGSNALCRRQIAAVNGRALQPMWRHIGEWSHCSCSDWCYTVVCTVPACGLAQSERRPSNKGKLQWASAKRSLWCVTEFRSYFNCCSDLNFATCTILQYVGWWLRDACRRSDVSDGDLHDSAAVLPAAAAGLHQSGARLLEHVQPYVSCFSDETSIHTCTAAYISHRPNRQSSDGYWIPSCRLICGYKMKVFLLIQHQQHHSL